MRVCDRWIASLLRPSCRLSRLWQGRSRLRVGKIHVMSTPWGNSTSIADQTPEYSTCTRKKASVRINPLLKCTKLGADLVKSLSDDPLNFLVEVITLSGLQRFTGLGQDLRQWRPAQPHNIKLRALMGLATSLSTRSGRVPDIKMVVATRKLLTIHIRPFRNHLAMIGVAAM